MKTLVTIGAFCAIVTLKIVMIPFVLAEAAQHQLEKIGRE